MVKYHLIFNIMKKKVIAAILLMAGKGERFNASLPKQFHNLSGKKIYLHTLDVFLKNEDIDQIILVSNKENIDTIKKGDFLFKGENR